MLEELSNFINSTSSSNEKQFKEAMRHEHRELQRMLFDLFYGCIEEWAKDYENNNFDGRNENSCRLSQVMVLAVEEERRKIIYGGRY